MRSRRFIVDENLKEEREVQINAASLLVRAFTRARLPTRAGEVDHSSLSRPLSAKTRQSRLERCRESRREIVHQDQNTPMEVRVVRAQARL
jgi:hypothetical protein